MEEVVSSNLTRSTKLLLDGCDSDLASVGLKVNATGMRD